MIFTKALNTRVIRVICLSLFLFVFVNDIIAQELTPVVLNYTKKDHHQDNQTWSLACGPDGAMYFANGKRLLRFDGQTWDSFSLPDDRIVRSVLSDGDRIYVGSFRQFGYFSLDHTGQMIYTSLSDIFGSHLMENDEIWSVVKMDRLVLFQSFTSVYVYDPDEGTINSTGRTGFIESIGITSDGIVLTSYGGLSVLDVDSGDLKIIPHGFGSRMVAVLNSAGRDYVITSRDGIFLLDPDLGTVKLTTGVDSILSASLVNRAAVDSEGNLVLGTLDRGCLAVSPSGQKLWHISTENILVSDTVLGIASDNQGNLWIGCNTSISMVSGKSGIRYIQSLEPNVGAVHTVYCNDPYIYIGTNNGLYRCMYDPLGRSVSKIERFPQVSGNVWTLNMFDGQLFCGTNQATYEISGRSIQRVEGVQDGGSCFAQGIIAGKEVLVEGTYVGLSIYVRKNGRWVFNNTVEGFIQPISSIDIDFRGNIWAAHNREGLFRIRLTDDLNGIRESEYYADIVAGSGKSRPVYVFRIDGRTFFSNGAEFATFDDMNGQIVAYEPLNTLSARLSSVRAVYSQKDGCCWFMMPKEVALVRMDDDAVEIVDSFQYSLFGSLSVDTHQDIQPGPEGMFVMSLNNSLAFISESADSSVESGTRPQLGIRGVTLIDEERSVASRLALDEPCPQIGSEYSIVRIDYSYPSFSTPGDLHFEAILEGRDLSWNDLGTVESLTLSHLAHGEYKLRLRAVSYGGGIQDEVEYSFRIMPPFYKSTLAVVLYIMGGLVLLLLVIAAVLSRIRSEKRLIENRRLESEIQLKSKEITAAAMNLIYKNQALQDIKNELVEQKRTLGDSYPDRLYRRLLNSIDSKISSEDDWNRYEQNYDIVHEDFFKTLRSRYPELTPTDLRFCSLFSMNLPSKEIAIMLNISLKGVEAARYRIRKKLGLPSDVNLTRFLLNL